MYKVLSKWSWTATMEVKQFQFLWCEQLCRWEPGLVVRAAESPHCEQLHHWVGPVAKADKALQ